MTVKRAFLALFLCGVIAVSFAALIQKQKNEFGISTIASLQRPTAPFSLMLPSAANLNNLMVFPTSSGITATVSDSLTYNSTRTAIFNVIVANPGIHFRGISASLGISIGLAEYHLGILKKSGLVSFFRDGKYKRFFASGKFSRKEMATISLLKHKTVAEIFKILLDKPRVSHSELASRLGITSQALTWQMQNLKETTLIMQAYDGLKTFYLLSCPDTEMLTKCIAVAERNLSIN